MEREKVNDTKIYQLKPPRVKRNEPSIPKPHKATKAKIECNVIPSLSIYQAQ